MNDTQWDILPHPYLLIADPHPILDRGELPDILRRLLEDATGLAGVIAMATIHPECDEADVRCATRLLGEHLHATMALWRTWREQEEPSEAEA